MTDTATAKKTPAQAIEGLKNLVLHLRSEYQMLYNDQFEWRNHWSQLSKYLDPYSGRYLEGQTTNGMEDRGRRKDQYRLNSTPSKVMQVYQACVSEGLFPRTRPFAKLKTSDPYYMGSQKVKEWLFQVDNMIVDAMEVNYFYKAGKNLIKEGGIYGSAQMFVNEHPRKVSFCKTNTIGEYVWGMDAYGEVGASQTRYMMTAYQIMSEFGKDNVPEFIKQAIKNNNQHNKYVVYHAVFPVDQFADTYNGNKDFKWRSLWYTDQHDPKEILRDSGYYTKPMITFRSTVQGCSVYGSSDGMEGLGDIKMLQKLEKDKIQALGVQIAPPMIAPIGMRPIGLKLYPNAVNYAPNGVNPDQVKPLFEFQFPLKDAQQEISNVEDRIKDILHYNELLAIMGMEKQATAFEVAKRLEEKIMVVGPTLDAYKTDFLAPTIERIYNILLNNNLLPPMPPEMQGAKLKIEYTSFLAQLQKMVGASTYEQALDYETRMVQVYGQKILQNVNADQKLRDYYEMIGMPPTTLISTDKVDQMRQADAQKQQQAEQMQMAMAAAKTAKDASQAKMGNSNALEQVAGAAQQQ